jgi:hypothetical protein
MYRQGAVCRTKFLSMEIVPKVVESATYRSENTYVEEVEPKDRSWIWQERLSEV